MVSKDVLLEAKNVVDSLSQRVDSRVLAKSVELKPRIVSLAQRIYDLSSLLSDIINRAASIVEEGKRQRIYRVGSWFYLVLDKDGFVLVRNKPYTMTVSYRRGDGRLYVRTRGFEAVFSPSQLSLKHYAMSISIDPGSSKEIEDYQGELKYLLRKLGGIIEFQLYPVAEKRLPIPG